MLDNRRLLVTLVATCVMIVLGVALVFWAMQNEDDVSVIEVSLIDGASDPIVFDNLALLPGQSTGYTVRFSSYSSKKYDVSLDFFEDEDKKEYNTLKHFVRVKVEVGDKVLCDDLLERVIEGDLLGFPVDVGRKINTEMKVTYYMPDDIGNEAKGAGAAFKLLITAGNEDPDWDWD